MDAQRERMSVNAYREDLAYIHDIGHGDLARAAAKRTVEELRSAGFHQGTVVDLGCGSGIFAREVSRAGYSVMGVDASDAMVAIARQRSPESTFWVGSFASVNLPPCVAVAAIGEVLNYVGDEKNDTEERNALLRRVYDALVPGGFVIFDMAGSDRAPSAGPRRTFMEGPDWAVLVETELDETRHLLIRRTTSFRQIGKLYRRDTETHRLALVEPNDILESLTSVGFEAETFEGYGAERLPLGLTGFLGRKPQHSTV